VAGFERMDIAGQQLDVLKLAREHDGATVIVPVDKVPSTGLRRVAGRDLSRTSFTCSLLMAGTSSSTGRSAIARSASASWAGGARPRRGREGASRPLGHPSTSTEGALAV
jgi:hypothetical protein